MAENRSLNLQQQQAVTFGDGPLLIIAGAGTGKTTVITERIKYLILEKHIDPSNILALTFTEKAAAEMEERIDVALPYGYSQLWIETFHAFCDRVLRNDCIHIGLNPNYTLATEAETVLFIRKHLFKLQLEYFRPLGNPNKFIQGLIQHFSRLKDEDINPKEYMEYAENMQKQLSDSDEDTDEKNKIMELATAYKIYEELKATEGIMDFSDLISNTLLLFRTRKNVLQNYQKQFAYILLDEFQDTNFAQNELAMLLAGTKNNITAVGDDDQAIYSWRGAAVSNMVNFKKNFEHATIIALTQNYRSNQHILDTAYALIQHNNPQRLEVQEHINKKLIGIKSSHASGVEVLLTERGEEEAELVTKKIQELIKKEKYAFRDFAILVRANDHAQAFTRNFERTGVPYQFLGPGQLFQQEEIKDLIAYLKVLYNYEDSPCLYRVLCMPTFAIPSDVIATLLNTAKRRNLCLFDMLSQLDSTTIIKAVKEKLMRIQAMIHSHLGLVQTQSAGQILYTFLQESALMDQLINPKTSNDETHAENIAKFFEKLKTYETDHESNSVFAIVDWIELSMQMGESPIVSNSDWGENDAVNILTIHSSKGLEFPVVFMVNLVNQRFPSRERREQIPIPDTILKEQSPEGDYHLQEERRLAYVAMTRAKDMLFLTAAKLYGEGKRERKLSPFVAEAVGQAAIEKVTITKTLAANQLSLLDLFADTTSEEARIVAPAGKKPITISYLSYSQIQTYESCPLHYKLKYLLKIPTPQTASQTFGTSVHAVLRDFYQRQLAGNPVSIENLEELVKLNWIADGYTSREHEKLSYAKALHVVTTFLEKDFQKNHLPLSLETPFEFFLQKMRIAGRIDRIDDLGDGRIEIIDYKTGSNIPTERELKTNLQLTTYALAASMIKEAIFNKRPEEVVLSLYYIEEGKKLTTTRTLEQLEAAKEELVTKAQEIATSDFLCSKSIFCQNCEYKMLCNVKL